MWRWGETRTPLYAKTAPGKDPSNCIITFKMVSNVKKSKYVPLSLWAKPWIRATASALHLPGTRKQMQSWNHSEVGYGSLKTSFLWNSSNDNRSQNLFCQRPWGVQLKPLCTPFSAALNFRTSIPADIKVLHDPQLNQRPASPEWLKQAPKNHSLLLKLLAFKSLKSAKPAQTQPPARSPPRPPCSSVSSLILSQV